MEESKQDKIETFKKTYIANHLGGLEDEKIREVQLIIRY